MAVHADDTPMPPGTKPIACHLPGVKSASPQIPDMHATTRSPTPFGDPDADPRAGGDIAATALELARLQAAVGERDDMLALAAHELRNPLHALSLQLALARSTAHGGGHADLADRLRRAEATLKRYSERVTVLMELLAMPRARYPLSPRDADLSALVATLADSLEQEARSRGITLCTRVPASFPSRVDTVAIEQVVDNLLLNAFKHSGASTVTLQLEGDAAGWRLAVIDDGHGIAAEDQQAIFAKFAVASHSPRGAGTGLGLWIARRLVAAMDGRLELESAPGRGCTFTIQVPSRPDGGPA